MRSNRWVQLAAGIVGMIAVSNLQYNWTLFAEPVQNRFGATVTAVTFAFTLFLLTETWLVPLKAYLADNCDAWQLDAEGRWTRIKPRRGTKRRSAQSQLLAKLAAPDEV